MARKESKALRTRSPLPDTPVEAKRLPIRHGRNNVIRCVEEPEITEPRNKRRRTRVEEWERFESRTAPNGKRLTVSFYGILHVEELTLASARCSGKKGSVRAQSHIEAAGNARPEEQTSVRSGGRERLARCLESG